MRRSKVFLLLGIALSLLGTNMFLQPRYYNPIYRLELDFTGYNVPFGILLIVVGVFFILTTLWNKTEAGKAEPPQLLICPKCQKVQTSVESETLKCATCGIELEDLEGFYDRHPELKDKI